eukprot:SAG31_NODE_1638_length_7672_cov_4.225142_3_plen_92_part_00
MAFGARRAPAFLAVRVHPERSVLEPAVFAQPQVAGIGVILGAGGAEPLDAVGEQAPDHGALLADAALGALDHRAALAGGARRRSASRALAI